MSDSKSVHTFWLRRDIINTRGGSFGFFLRYGHDIGFESTFEKLFPEIIMGTICFTDADQLPGEWEPFGESPFGGPSLSIFPIIGRYVTRLTELPASGLLHLWEQLVIPRRAVEPIATHDVRGFKMPMAPRPSH